MFDTEIFRHILVIVTLVLIVLAVFMPLFIFQIRNAVIRIDKKMDRILETVMDDGIEPT